MKLTQWIALPLIAGVVAVGAACSGGTTEPLPEETQPSGVPTEPNENTGADPTQAPLETPGEEDASTGPIPEPMETPAEEDTGIEPLPEPGSDALEEPGAAPDTTDTP